MSRKITIGCYQMSYTKNEHDIESIFKQIQSTSEHFPDLILFPELFESNYFCQKENPQNFKMARKADVNKDSFLMKMSCLAKKYKVVLPISFFEVDNQGYYNSVIVFDKDGENLGVYRKSHIPTGPGYQEKYYFRPGNTGFRVFKTESFSFGVGICWDQWFPETVRALALKGAEFVVFPTSIGNEPQDRSINSLPHWKRTIQGHAAANMIPIAVSNRVGKEGEIGFYGNSFICDQYGEVVCNAGISDRKLIMADFDLCNTAICRASWGLFRDRRPELYSDLINKDSFCKGNNNRKTKNGRKKELTIEKHKVLAEWEEDKKCVVLWPHDPGNWKNSCEDGRKSFKQVVEAITQFGKERVDLFCHPDDLNSCKEVFKGNKKVDVQIALYNDCWARDITPVLTRNVLTGELKAWLADFDGYGKKFPFVKDNLFKNNVPNYLKCTRSRLNIILEGGAFETNGEKIAIMTKSSVLKRNKDKQKYSVEQILFESFGVEHFIWLERGLSSDRDTDGHVDNICRFVSKYEIALHWCENQNDPDYQICNDALEKIKKFIRKSGIKLKVVKIVTPSPRDFYGEKDVISLNDDTFGRKVGDPICLSYLNFYISREAVIAPCFGLETDEVARKQLQKCFTKRKVIQIHARDICLGGGGIHCITKDVPIY